LGQTRREIHFLTMQCPYCGSGDILHGPTKAIHVVRVLLGSPKRYCLSCDKKWMAKHSRRTFSAPVLVGLFAIAVLTVLLIEAMASRSYYTDSQNAGSGSAWQMRGGQKGQSSSMLGGITKAAASSAKVSGGKVTVAGMTLPLNLFGVDAKLVEKAQKKLKEDPNFISKLTPAQRKRAEEKARQYGLSLPG
jgi:hypothetical protein